MKRKGLNKIRNRKKIWDLFKWNYGTSPHKLWKNTLAGCQCSACKITRFYKRYRHKQNRVKTRTELNNIYDLF